MTKIVAISDTHNRHNKIKLPEGDIIIHAGDATGRGEEWEVKKFLKWYGKTPYNVKVFVAGNHDFLFEKDPKLAEKLCKDNGIIYLNDSGVEVQLQAGYPYINESLPDIPKIKIWGSPVQPHFCNWAFNRARDDKDFVFGRGGYVKAYPLIKPHWDMIPEDTNILVTHGPPYKILDELLFVDGTPKGEFVGCEELAKRVKEIKPDVHIFGHIHCGYGEKHIDGTSYYNVAVCDEMYSPSNEIKVIDYEEL
jgi:predicted phosphodiesterase